MVIVVDPTQNGLRKANKEALVVILMQLIALGGPDELITL